MAALLKDLSTEQQACVEHPARVLQILAGPGSGKVWCPGSRKQSDSQDEGIDHANRVHSLGQESAARTNRCCDI